MSPESLHSYIPHHHDSPLPTQNLGALSSSAWFAASNPAVPDQQNETGYASYTYDQPYVTPHTSSITYSPSTQLPKPSETVVSVAKVDGSVAAYSPVSDYSRASEHEYKPQLAKSYANAPTTTMEPATHLQVVESNPPSRPRSSTSTYTPNHASNGPIDYQWPMNPLGISTPTAMHEQYYSSASYPSVRARNPRLSEPPMELHTNSSASQPRRMYAPIAPHPIAPQRMGMQKRSRDDDETSEQSKRRKRSDSNTTMPVELGEEDKLLIQLKDEESMPWKDIAARFQSDLGKTYQIPALQMRLKRLRERMRVWTETDIRALRMAHEFWVQSKFDIIGQKVSTLYQDPPWS
ncbi:hypothetical protein K504DRAFT_523424 [Pleomassaria siparia CBS 279.74]|uniref:Uncharacterized protein n=1 Tax=Pleomassaria siparia CBS 279.74 TaxID=1314801 RepID=A0A6G1KGC6_9PLEO|nr:hypothetical protein K504DRAFT_523424 [Pleomassaria siparia CBS 279.74]